MDRTAAVDLLRGLVAIPSISRDEARASAYLADAMRAHGYDRAYVDEAGNAVGELGAADAARTIVLLGHIDTVPGNIPVRIDGEGDRAVLFGRGSVDAKGPLAAFAAAGARLGSAWAHQAGVRVVVVGAVEEEAATSKGARYIASRFNGVCDKLPEACVIGEPSHWRRVTLGYKGRLLLDLQADQPMAHTAGPDASVASIVVDVWNWVTAHAARANAGREKAFDQLSPSLRRFNTSSTESMSELAEAQIAWRLPVGFDAGGLASELLAFGAARVGAPPHDAPLTLALGDQGRDLIRLEGERTALEFRFRGWERPWRADRNNALVRAFLAAIRTTDASAQPGFVLKTGTSDMNVVAPIWQCPILAYGPGDSALDHTPNEHQQLDEFWRAVIVLEHALRLLATATAG
jgi:LysW-gamma-L-lysine carboxypeptidase